jgi:3-oxoacyl-[acyl-carrier protein] reductase
MIIVITGASGGIGSVTAARFARDGHSVALLSRNEAKLGELAQRIAGEGGRALGVRCDVADSESVRAAAARVESELGVADVVVNNAAAFAGGRAVVDTDPGEFERVIRTNLVGPFLVSRAFLPAMIERGGGGTIVMVSSTSGKRGDARGAAYAASKHGLNGLTHSLLYELRPHDIRVVTISPSGVDTRPGVEPPDAGRGVRLRAEDVAEAIHLAATLPGRALVRDLELWSTNPA